MLNYCHSDIYIVEVPNELSLGISIYGCPLHCKGCHSPEVWNTSTNTHSLPLSLYRLDKLIQDNEGISCVLFYGGEWDSVSLKCLLRHLRANYSHLKTALYTGLPLGAKLLVELIPELDYIKVGAYKENLGAITSKTTNQRMYKIDDGIVSEDITHEFWRFL